jgi:hypothetical protein
MQSVDQQAVKHATKVKIPGLLSPQKLYIISGLIVALILSIVTIEIAGLQQGILLWIGLLLGFALFHARFGFTSAFRRLMAVGNGKALRAHMVMMAAACTLFAPILASGFGFFGVNPAGNVHQLGVNIIVGAFLFGVGMQLGSGCASGTLYHIGEGRGLSIVTLIGFIIGSVIGAWHWGFWVKDIPSIPGISLATSTGWGYFGAWIVSMIIFAAVFAISMVIEKKRRPPQMEPLPTAKGWKRVIRGSWPLWAAAVVLAVLNAATLVVKGSPWGVTSAFALWGSKAAQAVGIDVSGWTYWSGKTEELHQSVFMNATSVMDFGIIVGAFLACALGGLFVFKKKIPGKILLASLIGGLLMGYGARLAFGCNIGAYFSGIASFSLHGWLWMLSAMGGTYLSLYLMPLFGLKVPKPKDNFC